MKDGKWTVEEIKQMLLTRKDAVMKGMCRIYELQTEQEKNVGDTIENNGIGFNGVDGEIMSSFVQFYKAKGFLTEKQMVIAQKKMPKYAKQLTKIANNEVIVKNLFYKAND